MDHHTSTETHARAEPPLPSAITSVFWLGMDHLLENLKRELNEDRGALGRNKQIRDLLSPIWDKQLSLNTRRMLYQLYREAASDIVGKLQEERRAEGQTEETKPKTIPRAIIRLIVSHFELLAARDPAELSALVTALGGRNHRNRSGLGALDMEHRVHNLCRSADGICRTSGKGLNNIRLEETS